MLTCKEIAKLVSQSLDRKLSLRQRMAVRVHLMMCSLCRTYRHQMLALRRIVRQSGTPPEKSLSAEASQRIKRAIKSDEEL